MALRWTLVPNTHVCWNYFSKSRWIHMIATPSQLDLSRTRTPKKLHLTGGVFTAILLVYSVLM